MEKAVFYSVLFALTIAGRGIGARYTNHDLWTWFTAMALAALLFAARCFGALKAFSAEVAKAVFRDFYIYKK